MTETIRTIAFIGATSGLGRTAADQLARDGHRLVLVGRDPKRVQRLAEQVPGAVVIGADVATSAGIDHAVTRIESAVDHLDALVNNAGVMIPTRRTTDEGIELNLAVHHLAPYSMTGRLLPLLRAGAGRVVNVNSEGHRAPLFGGGHVGIDLDDLNMEHGYEPFLAYSRTKLANLLFTYELQRRHPELSVVAVHPGMVRTDLGRHWPRLQVAAMHAMSISARKGAKPVLSLATAPRVEHGAYYNRFTTTRSSAESYDPHLAHQVWTATETLRGPFGG
ncbi:MAG TPA: SDR family NAD(P)-dependent oxidoreductase [Streptosporangiaceae bacterium]|jgi:NAD(P)-dependent dehydrogenase (short-subunit alcohol dehydrogenase family)